MRVKDLEIRVYHLCEVLLVLVPETIRDLVCREFKVQGKRRFPNMGVCISLSRHNMDAISGIIVSGMDSIAKTLFVSGEMHLLPLRPP